jgi:hypothetical protein
MIYRYVCPTELTAVDMIFALRCKGIKAIQPPGVDNGACRVVYTKIKLPKKDLASFQAVELSPIEDGAEHGRVKALIDKQANG